MIKEKKFLLILRLVLLGLIFCLALTGFLISKFTKVNLVDESLEADYSSYSNSSFCYLELTLDNEIDSGYITIEFFDKQTNFLSVKTINVTSYDNTVYEYFSVDGEVEYYNILDYSFNAEIPYWIYSIAIILFLVFLITLLCRCKTYLYNGNVIVIYAGFKNHYIKINGKLADEFVSLLSYTPIRLSCLIDGNETLTATITITNNITSVKINEKLQKACKITKEDIEKINN